MVYDTLFAMDANLQVKPQMVDKLGDQRRRPHLDLHAARRARMARRRAGDGGGRHRLAEALVGSAIRWARSSLPTCRSTRWSTPRPSRSCSSRSSGRCSTALGKPSVVVPFMMPEAGRPRPTPFKQIDDVIGSGPFIFKRDEWKPGEKIVFVKNPKYKPRRRADLGPGRRQVGAGRPRRMGLDPRLRRRRSTHCSTARSTCSRASTTTTCRCWRRPRASSC